MRKRFKEKLELMRKLYINLHERKGGDMQSVNGIKNQKLNGQRGKKFMKKYGAGYERKKIKSDLEIDTRLIFYINSW